MIELNLENAIDILKKDGIILYPTETFFGIGCKMSSETAILNIFKIKKRLLAMPLPTITSDLDQVFQFAMIEDTIKNDVIDLASLFWPGPLTFILPARTFVPDILTGGTKNIAIRQSSHPIAIALADGIKEPVISSSANISGGEPVTTIHKMNKDILQKVNGYIDSDIVPQGGLASTIISFAGNRTIKILREGVIPSTVFFNHNFNIIG